MQAALAIENVARSQADSEHTVVPVSAASNAGATGRRLPVPSSPVVARKAAEQEQTLLDLLSLHEALVALQGQLLLETEMAPNTKASETSSSRASANRVIPLSRSLLKDCLCACTMHSISLFWKAPACVWRYIDALH